MAIKINNSEVGAVVMDSWTLFHYIFVHISLSLSPIYAVSPSPGRSIIITFIVLLLLLRNNCSSRVEIQSLCKGIETIAEADQPSATHLVMRTGHFPLSLWMMASGGAVKWNQMGSIVVVVDVS